MPNVPDWWFSAMSAAWIELVAAVLTGVPRLDGALCRQQPELFDGGDDTAAARAAQLCARCPARDPCGAWADTLRHNEASGVMAGQYREWVSHPSQIRTRETNPTATRQDQRS